MTGLEIAGSIAIYAAIGLSMIGILTRLLMATGRIRARLGGAIEDALALPLGICFLVGAMKLAYEHAWGMAGIHVVLGALFFRNWWNRRGRKRAAKLAARVRNLGHRLVVVPVTGGARRSLA